MKAMKQIFLVVLLSFAAGLLFEAAESQAGTDDIQPPHDETALPDPISCDDCHVPFGTAPNPAPDDWITTNICWSCHVESGTAQWQNVHVVADTMWCQDCHNPHQHQDVFPQWYIYDYIDTPNSGRRDLAFQDSTDYIHGDPGVYQPYDGICETCHTETDFHRNNASGDHTHMADHDCVACHTHEDGFLATGGYNCLLCHGDAMGSRRAIGPEFNDPLGHHPLTYNESGNLESPQDNNCIICHLEGVDQELYHADGDVDLNPDPDNSGSSEWQNHPDIYDGASGLDPDDIASWWCLDCHDADNPDPNYQLGGMVAPDMSDFWQASTHRTNYPNSGMVMTAHGCNSCHQNGHTQEQAFYSIFYIDTAEEFTCYGCHGGSSLVKGPGNVVLESIRVAYYGLGEVASTSKHATEAMLNTNDGHTFCRDCHNPHRLDYTNMLCDPDNPENVWTGTMDDFCLTCHDGNPQAAPVHNGVTISTEACLDCHLPHSSTLVTLSKVDISTQTIAVSPDPASTTVGGSINFDNLVTPAYSNLSQDIVDGFTQWGISTSSGGSVGTIYTRNDSIPLDRSVGYDPSGWGLITVTSELVIVDDITIEDLNVFSQIWHHYRGDIGLTLLHVDTGTEVQVQAVNWNDWEHDLIFWYDSESPNGQFSAVSPRSTAGSLAAFNGESSQGTWRLTIEDTWPSDNPTDPTDPDFCWVELWKLAFNDQMLGTFITAGNFDAQYDGAGTVSATLHEGPIYPHQTGGLYVSVWENTPLQAFGSLTVGASDGLRAPVPPSGWSNIIGPVRHELSLPDPGYNHEAVIASGQSCTECHVNRITK